ncbi:trypsin [Dictyocaulus viviparus]|uniref:Trypsin n=1 Tax=Dictyocaulus viviparus TaxID=29172 RepID=A0A0D8X8S4_DICVI|nr:trypsin [Dictyocaulus viviparus]
MCSSLYSVISAGRAKVYPGTKVNDLSSIPIYTSSSRIVTVHPRFDPCSRGNDLAVLEISPNMFSDGSPICMPSANESVPTSLTSTGFGLNPVDFVLPHKGDSGGPLFKNENGTHILLGIMSQGDECKKRKKKKNKFVKLSFFSFI